MSNLITPYLPIEAEREARAWMAGGKPTFVKAMEHSSLEHGCPNCGGVGAVFVVFCNRGPLRNTTLGKDSRGDTIVNTWFDGDGRFGKGWYVIERTEAYTCPECQGQTKETGEYVLPPRREDPIEVTVTTLAGRLAERLHR